MRSFFEFMFTVSDGKCRRRSKVLGSGLLGSKKNVSVESAWICTDVGPKLRCTVAVQYRLRWEARSRLSWNCSWNWTVLVSWTRRAARTFPGRVWIASQLRSCSVPPPVRRKM